MTLFDVDLNTAMVVSPEVVSPEVVAPEAGAPDEVAPKADTSPWEVA